MKGRIWGLAAVVSLGATTLHAQSVGAESAVEAGEAAYSCPVFEPGLGAPIATVRYLADDALEGRFSGSRGEACAAEFVAKMFAEIGLEPAGEEGWFQSLPLASVATPHAPTGTGRNVLGLLRGTDPAAGLVVVVVFLVVGLLLMFLVREQRAEALH